MTDQPKDEAFTWSSGHDEDGHYVSVWAPPKLTGAADVLVCELPHDEIYEHTQTLAEAEARATILAASSDLLAALEAMIEPYRFLTEGALEAGVLMEFGPPKPEQGRAILAARAAIRKARGGE